MAAAPNSAWQAAVATIVATDAFFAAAPESLPTPKANEVCAIAAAARREMWGASPPSLAELAWKLEQAIVYEDLEHDDAHPLNAVLRDLRQLVGAN